MRLPVQHDDDPMLPWGTVTADFWATTHQQDDTTDQSAPPVPSEPAVREPVADGGADESVPPPPQPYQQRIAAVTAAFSTAQDSEALAAAEAEAQLLDQEITAQYGPAHPYTINIRELRGWLAHVKGQHGVATRWYLHTAGLQGSALGPRHRMTRESAHRAAHTWNSITDYEEALGLSSELLDVLAASSGEGSAAFRSVLARVRKLRAGRPKEPTRRTVS
ncbi:hypothetical protein GCM10010218_31450 [Streptomyces mashuensis]|uniref:Uncharacterized protein n=1 Tax=Streptomyces mashuensis TaxID=33904 RepID=A0A919B2Y5_9ACTN|nr:hypothetical protein [Streptomyces mashuensis]GHF47748.1 hypothetical protein GCM10010218_31450 [Streptomyces mashuensis]